MMEVPCINCLVKGICISKMKSDTESVLDLACELMDEYVDEWANAADLIKGLEFVYKELRYLK